MIVVDDDSLVILSW